MANLLDDLGNALVAAARDTVTHLVANLDEDTADSAIAIEYTLIPVKYESARHAEVAPDGVEILRKFRGSAHIRVHYRVSFLLEDSGGKQNVTPEVLVGMINAWGDGGYDLFKNHFTDAGSNMGAKNGDVELLGKAQIFGGDPDRAQDGQDYNYPVVVQDVAITVWTAWPMT